MRASEALAIREIDVDFGSSLTDKNEPAKVKVRKEYSKTRTERLILFQMKLLSICMSG